MLAGVRRWLYRAGIFKSSRIDVPVIVVGNVTVGGTGKTAVVLAIAQLLERAGWHCGIISRGYSRTRSGTGANATHQNVIYFVAGTNEIPANVGAQSDEAVLLARRSGVPVYIAADRAAAAHALLHNHPAVDVVICDDGLQHYALRRDIEICVIDGERGFGNGALLPAGPLREPASRVKLVDAIVVNGESNLDVGNSVPTYTMRLGNESLVRLKGEQILSVEQALAMFSAQAILAIAGTGNPERFFTHLRRLGFRLDESTAFPDHHPYAPRDLASKTAPIILMTEKDAVKCIAFADDRMWFLRVDAILPEPFGQLVKKKLSELKK